MCKEDYVNFEIAKLLKEKGFDESCYKKYNSNGDLFDSTEFTYGPKDPTLQMAMKWLREIHNIFIQIELYSNLDDYCFEVFQNTHSLIAEKDEVYNSYETACEAAIKYCLENLI